MNRQKYRHELKYLCCESELQVIESKIKSICRKDKYGDEDGQYNIRSVYFDTYDDICFRENEAGVDKRKKYRIRIYNNNAEVIKLECKSSLHGLKRKESCLLTKEQCIAILKCNFDIKFTDNQKLLENFLCESKIRRYIPKVIVDYQRTAYIFPVGNVRITVDRNISSSGNLSAFFEKNIPRRPVTERGKHILEIKYDELLPDFFWRILSCRNMQRCSFSKYYLCRKMHG